MLARTSYSPAFVEDVRREIEAEVATFSASARALRTSGADETAVAVMEQQFYTAHVVRLDAPFVHRLRGGEGKDGNPCNEVRVLVESLVEHGGVLTPVKTIRLDPATSVLGLAPGASVVLDEDGFRRLAAAFLAEIGARFGSP